MARADAAFGLLIALALGSAAILISLLGTLLPRVTEVLTAGPSDVESLVVAVVLVLAVCGIALGFASLVRQLLATADLIGSLLARRVAMPRRLREATTGLGLTGRIDVVDDERPFSFCYWFMRPRICISTALVHRLERGELRAVLRHERYHLEHRDPLRLVVARTFAAGLYVVPLVNDIVSYYTVQKEIEADQEAVRHSRSVRALASALYKMLPDAEDLKLGLLVPVSALSVTEARIDRLVGGRPLRPGISVASVVLSLGTLLGASAIAHAQACLTSDCTVWPAHFPETPLLASSAVLLLAAAVAGGSAQLRTVAARR